MAMEEVRNDLGWTVVGNGRKKEYLQLTLSEAQPIPVICNHFVPLNNLMIHKVDTFNLTMPRQRNRTSANKNRLEKGRKHKTLITGDSHAKGMAAEL
jgi:hypothetical protein